MLGLKFLESQEEISCHTKPLQLISVNICVLMFSSSVKSTYVGKCSHLRGDN